MSSLRQATGPFNLYRSYSPKKLKASRYSLSICGVKSCRPSFNDANTKCFELLELVKLEMDLPVIMLAANGDAKLVMKGLTRGACNYLLKPAQSEELKSISQQVVRKKICDKKDQNDSNGQKQTCSGSNGAAGMANAEN